MFQLRNIDFNISKDYIETGDLRLNIKTTNLLCLKTNESIDIRIFNAKQGTNDIQRKNSRKAGKY